MAEIKWTNVDGAALNGAVSNAQNASNGFAKSLTGLGSDIAGFTDKLQQRADETAKWERDQATQAYISKLYDATSLEDIEKLKASGVLDAQNALNAGAYRGQIDLSQLNQAKSTIYGDTLNRAKNKDDLLNYTPESREVLAQARDLIFAGKTSEAAQLVNSSNLSNVAKANVWNLAFKSMVENLTNEAKLNETGLTLSQQNFASQQALNDWLVKNNRSLGQLVADMEAGRPVPEEFKKLYSTYLNSTNQLKVFEQANKKPFEYFSGGDTLNFSPAVDLLGNNINKADARLIQEQNQPTPQAQNSFGSNEDAELVKATEQDDIEEKELVANNPTLAEMLAEKKAKERQVALASEKPNSPHLSQLKKDLQAIDQNYQAALQTVRQGESNTERLKKQRLDSDTTNLIKPSKSPFTQEFIKKYSKDGVYDSDSLDAFKAIVQSDYDKARTIAQEAFGIPLNKVDDFLSKVQVADSGQIANTIKQLNDVAHNLERLNNQIDLSEQLADNPVFKNFDHGVRDTFLNTVIDSRNGFSSKIAKDSKTIFGNEQTNLTAQTVIDKLKSTYSGLDEGLLDNITIRNYIETAIENKLPPAYIAAAIENTIIDAAKRQGKKVEDGENLAGIFALGSKNFDQNDFDKLGSLLSGDISAQVRDAQRYAGQHLQNQETIRKNGGIGAIALFKGIESEDIKINSDGTVSFQASPEDILSKLYGEKFSGKHKEDSLQAMRTIRKTIITDSKEFTALLDKFDQRIKAGEDSETVAIDKERAIKERDDKLAREYASFKAAYNQMKVHYAQLKGQDKVKGAKLLSEVEKKLDTILRHKKRFNI